MGYNLVTNYAPRILMCWHDIPAPARGEFDYLPDASRCEGRFVRYRGTWFDVFGTSSLCVTDAPEDYAGAGHTCHPGEPLAWFDAVAGTSWWTGVAFRFVGLDRVVVGRFWG